jgi:hypothetical protein
MLEKLHKRSTLQLLMALAIGICFGFLLQRGGVTRYDVIMGQLLLADWTVFKVILTAIVTGMVGIFVLRIPGLARLHIWSGSVGSTVVGGLIFGFGFAILGYCPGTLAGAVGQGSLDAIFGGVPGMLSGAAGYAAIYPTLSRSVLKAGQFEKDTLPQLTGTAAWPWVAAVAIGAAIILGALEAAGL